MRASCGKNPKLIRQVVGLMLEGVPVRLGRLEAAIVAGDGDQVVAEAHSLKRAFTTVGAGALAESCQVLITLGEGGDVTWQEELSMKLPRVTVRRLMIHVEILALVTVFLGQVAMPWAARRSDEFRELGRFHSGPSWAIDPADRNRLRADWNSPRLREYHARMAEKYRRAARYPWLPVAPDPPEPE